VSAAQEAAAALVPGMVAQLVETVPGGPDDQLAGDLAATQSVVAAPETVPSSQPQTAPVAAAQAPVATPVEEPVELDLEPVIPDDLQALLDEPDFEEEAALEVADEQDEYDEDATDPETAKKVRALEKRNAWLEEQRVKSESKKWVDENLKAYPLLRNYAAEEVAAIKATSRRGFAREAAALNARFAKMLEPALKEIEAAKKQLRPEIETEVRSEYKEGWGTITTGPGTVPVEADEKAAEYTAAMRAGNLPRAIGALLRGAGVNNQ
jgi:hypothetical protein